LSKHLLIPSKEDRPGGSRYSARLTQIPAVSWSSWSVYSDSR